MQRMEPGDAPNPRLVLSIDRSERELLVKVVGDAILAGPAAQGTADSAIRRMLEKFGLPLMELDRLTRAYGSIEEALAVWSLRDPAGDSEIVAPVELGTEEQQQLTELLREAIRRDRHSQTLRSQLPSTKIMRGLLHKLGGSILEIGEVRIGRCIVLSPIGRLPESVETLDFEEALLRLIATDNDLVIDFSGVEQINSTALRALVMASKHLSGRVAITGLVHPDVYQKYSINRFDLVIPVFASVEEAMSSWSVR